MNTFQKIFNLLLSDYTELGEVAEDPDYSKTMLHLHIKFTKLLNNYEEMSQYDVLKELMEISKYTFKTLLETTITTREYFNEFLHDFEPKNDEYFESKGRSNTTLSIEDTLVSMQVAINRGLISCRNLNFDIDEYMTNLSTIALLSFPVFKKYQVHNEFK